MITINPYLNFAGNTEDAFNFYKSIFGGEFAVVMRYKDTFEAERTADADKDKLMHVALPIGKGNMLMGTDVLGQMAQDLVQSNSFYICMNGETPEETEKLFAALAVGGKVVYPFDKAPWGGYFGQLVDQFGIQWMADSMSTINPYLNFAGNTEEAFNFYRSVFGGDFFMLIRFKDSPEADRTPKEDLDKLMHISLPIGEVGKGNVLMATDAIGKMGEGLERGNNCHLTINGGDVEETRALFNALAAGGGSVIYPFDIAPWDGSYFGMLTDQFGVQWMADSAGKQQ
ncbi:VOC family protein [Mucilaginibacter lappiensis]|uniref:Putative glyoxalase superfamily protein PhnB n=1 Tax=Mucilaginibacter lappiensis TaxID=354630 RepID=A0A841JA36_9SPHI|nr:VOC family protein [Mucilaginibacter lappiensis]MBB6127544.1 putative glyoxalase superfamily protein PhnB [Mucilaginibacter lappiensis]